MRLTLLSLIIFLLIGCGKSPSDIYQEGKTNYDKGNYAEALLNFKEIREHYPEDSLASKVLYKMIRINLDFLRDYDAGKAVYDDLVMNYAGSEESKQARKEMERFPKWLFVKSESLQNDRRIREALTTLDYIINKYPEADIIPKVQFTIGDIHMNDLRDFPKALSAYKQVIDGFPESMYAPRAKFMLGFIYANLLNDLEKAEYEYKEFLEKYPGHELEASVQFELKFLGKDINSINDLNQTLN